MGGEAECGMSTSDLRYDFQEKANENYCEFVTGLLESPRDADEERNSGIPLLDARTFLSVIMSFCLSPSTSANWRLN